MSKRSAKSVPSFEHGAVTSFEPGPERGRDLSVKRAVNLTASTWYLDEARRLGMNFSEIFGEALARAVEDARREEFKREHAAYVEWANKDIDDNGLWSDGLRMF